MKEAHTVYHLKPKLDDSSGNGYVGVCISMCFADRMKEHAKARGNCSKLYNYLRKRHYEQGVITARERKRVFKKCFHVVILHEEVCGRREAELLERGFILELDTLSPNGLNLKTGNYRGAHSDETRRKLSEAHKGKKHSEASKRKISESHKGVKISDETRRKIRLSLKGHKTSDETKQKIGDAHRGRKLGDEHKKKIRESNSGKKRSEETKRKMSDAKQGNKNGRGRKYKTAVKLTLEFDL